MSENYLKALNVGSGLDTATIVAALVDARKAPREASINERIDDRNIKISAFSEVKKAMQDFETNTASLAGVTGLSVSSAGPEVTATLTDSGIATGFSTNIEVSSLAKSQTLVFDGFSGADDELGAGSLSFAYGTWSDGRFTTNGSSDTVTISDGSDTLENIAATINDADIGVTASVVKKSDSNYALVMHSEPGADNALSITAVETSSGSGLADLGYSTYDATVETIAASDLSMSMDGVAITRESNIVTDLVDGVTLTINDTTSSAVTVSGAHDTATAFTAASSLVTEINSLLTMLNNLTARGGTAGVDGDLAGDAFARGMISSIRSILNEAIAGFGDSSVYLANFGVLTNRDGSISINETTFNAAYEADPDSFNALLNSRVTTNSQLVSGSVAGSDYVPGSYSFVTDGSSATLDGDAMTASGSRFSINSGDADGLSVSISGNGADTTIYVGTSLLESLQDYTVSMTKFNGSLSERLQDYSFDISEYNDELTDLDDQIEKIRQEYLQRFTDMDVALASFNRTGDSLDAMMEGWKAMNQ